MAYVGGRLAPLYDGAPMRRAMRDIADAGGDYLLGQAKRFTEEKTGELRRGWKRSRVKKLELGIFGRLNPGYEVKVYNEVEHALYREEGTGLWGPMHAKYPIPEGGGPMPPGRFMRWRDPKTGRWVYAKRVMHPGSRGRHMLKQAVNVVEHEVGAIAGPILRRWVVEQEALS